jgi:glycosyltransferase involved in cell wall biosynthesis
LATAIVRLIKNPKLRDEFGKRGQALARHYSWDHVAHRVMSYYERILYEHTEVAASRAAHQPVVAAGRDA